MASIEPLAPSRFLLATMPYAEARRQKFLSQQRSFIHYTSADNAVKIIKNEEIWLRNASLMNDRSEAIHGYNCLKLAFNSSKGKQLQNFLTKICAISTNSIREFIENGALGIRFHSYLSCISEHRNSNIKFGKVGKLSMWRAYAPKNGVAIVLNSKPFFSQSSPFGAFTSPVAYFNDDQFQQAFVRIANNIFALDKREIEGNISEFFGVLHFALQASVVSTKHPIFFEEEEWRVIGWPDTLNLNRGKRSTETIQGVPQIVCKIPLKDVPEEGYDGLSIPTFIEKIIVGPSEFPYEIRESLVNVLWEAGITDAPSRVAVSNIPLR